MGFGDFVESNFSSEINITFANFSCRCLRRRTLGKFKNKTSKSATTRRQQEADERTAAEASAADADGHTDSNAGVADDAGAQSSSGSGGSSSGGGGGGELKVNLWSLISSTESNHIFDFASHFSKRSRSSRPLVAPARHARS